VTGPGGAPPQVHTINLQFESSRNTTFVRAKHAGMGNQLVCRQNTANHARDCSGEWKDCTSPASPCHYALQGAPRRPFIGYPPPGMYMGYGMDMGPYRGRGRGPMPMQPGRFAQPAYGYGYGYGYFPPPYAQPFPGRMPQGVQIGGGRGFIGERRPPPGTPGVSSGLQVICCLCCTLAAHAILHRTGRRHF